MTRATTTSLSRICPACGARNRVTMFTAEIRPDWRINCSACGATICEGRTGRAQAQQAQAADRARPVPAFLVQPKAVAACWQPATPAGRSPARRHRRCWPSRIATHLCLAAACAAFLAAFVFDTAAPRGATETAAGGTVLTSVAHAGDARTDSPLPAARYMAPGPSAPEQPAAPPSRLATELEPAAQIGSEAVAAPAAGTEPGAAGGPARLAAARPIPWGAYPDPRAVAGRAAGTEPGAEGGPVRLAAARPIPTGAYPDPRAGIELAAVPAGPEAAEAALGLSRGTRLEVQRRLALVEFDPRMIDGIFGPATRAAIGAWQEATGLPPTGYLDGAALARLEQETESAYHAWRKAAAAGARERTRFAALTSPVPPARPGPDACRRELSGEIVYGRNIRCDFRGLREDFRELRQNIGHIFGSGSSTLAEGGDRIRGGA